MTTAPNRFFVWPTDAPAPVEVNPHLRAGQGAEGDLRYFHGLARELDRRLGDRGITFALTWHLDEFDERWRGGVVILVGDEKYQTPAYARAVRALFKTGGTRRNPLGDTLRLAPSVAWRVLLREARNANEARRRHGLRGPPPVAMFEIPLGYFGLVESPPTPYADRPTDVFFAGSVETGRSFTVRPRLAARRQMLAALATAERRNPRLRVDCTRSGPFANAPGMLSASAYTARLMQAKIALCPRGNFDETFRVAEAAKAGCVAIVERLPRRWYNRDAPAVQLDRWTSLPEVLEQLLADDQALARRSEQMRAWWTHSLSEQAVAAFIAGVLDRG